MKSLAVEMKPLKELLVVVGKESDSVQLLSFHLPCFLMRGFSQALLASAVSPRLSGACMMWQRPSTIFGNFQQIAMRLVDSAYVDHFFVLSWLQSQGAVL